MSTWTRAAGAIALAAPLAAATGCASLRYGRMAPPEGARALGIEFAVDRAAAERGLREAGVSFRAAADDAEALVADRCPGAPVAAPCRLSFGPHGLYAAQVEVPASQRGALERAVEKGLGAPDAVADARAPEASAPEPLTSWHRPGWTVGVSRVAAAGGGPSVAVLRVERDPVAPPVVAGVPLGKLRGDVERLLERQGATVVQRDGEDTTYLGCPQGAGEALSCVVHFQAGRAVAVTEIHPSAPDDAGALEAWRALSRRLEGEIGRAPETSCPDSGPDRVAGDCTATWASDRLSVVVGAHRNAGAQHRGGISVYTAFTYPALATGEGEDAGSAEVR